MIILFLKILLLTKIITYKYPGGKEMLNVGGGNPFLSDFKYYF
jgi:hypothetical protein